MTETITPAQLKRRQAAGMKEAELQEQVRQIALASDWIFYHTWNSRKSSPGFPDCVMLRGDRMVVAELKREGKKPTPAQQEWLSAFREVTDEVYIWRPSDLVAGVIHEVLL